MRKRKRRSKGGGRYCHRFTGDQIMSDWSRMVIMNLGELKKQFISSTITQTPSPTFGSDLGDLGFSLILLTLRNTDRKIGELKCNIEVYT